MKTLEGMSDRLSGYFFFPLLNYLANRKTTLQDYKNLLKADTYSKETLQAIQLTRLRNVIDYSAKWVPYYRELFKKIGLSSHDIRRPEDIKSIPPLTRQDVIDRHREMVDVRLESSIEVAEKSTRGVGAPIPFAIFRKHKLIRNSSSGSTGAPTIFYEDGSITSLNWSQELRLKSWYGINPGAKEARMARVSTDYLPGSKAVMLRKILWRQLMLPGVNLADKDYALCFKSIIEFRPKVLWGFTSALAGLAEYIKNNIDEGEWYAPELIITWAAPLYEHEKRIMSQVYKCPVTNIYGAREVGHIAALCPKGSLHINQESLFVESENGQEEGAEEAAGELLVTTLSKTPMPFIRYRMGDLGKVTDSKCKCGRALQVLTNFLGRTGEVYKTKDGRMISPNFWCRTFMNEQLAAAVKRFQIVYALDGSIRIRIVQNSNYSPAIENQLRGVIEKNFNSEDKVDFEYVNKIDPQVSGKYQMVVKEKG